MKKVWKRLIAVAVATLMLISMLPAAVMAAGVEERTNGTIQIEKYDKKDTQKGLEGAEFSLYKLATITKGNTWEFSVENEFQNILGDDGKKKNLNDLVASAWEQKITELDLAAETPIQDGVLTTDDDGKTAKQIVDFGIYLVKETKAPEGYMASSAFIVSVPSTNNYDTKGKGDGLTYDIVARPKNEELTIEKEIKNENKDVAIGDTVQYEIRTAIPNYGPEYAKPVFKIYDKMGSGLDLNYEKNNDEKKIVVNVDGVNIQEGDSTYTIKTEQLENGKTFEIEFSMDYIKGNPGKPVVVSYSAIVNKDAAYEINNNAGIHFNRTPGEEDDATTGDKKVYTYTIDLTKVGEGDDTQGLDGAVFSLTNDKKEELHVVINGEEKATIVNADTELKTATVEMKKGKLVIKGLAAGTYTLTEVKSPAGYTLLKNPITIVLEANTDGTLKNATVDGEIVTPSNGSVAVTVNNHKGFTLPETGGMGTYIFTIGGVILMAGAIILLLTMKKKKDA